MNEVHTIIKTGVKRGSDNNRANQTMSKQQSNQARTKGGQTAAKPNITNETQTAI